MSTKTTIVAHTNHCSKARVFSRFASRARSLSRLTFASRASYKVLSPAIAAFRATVPAGFHEQVYVYACADNCERCQLADLSRRRGDFIAMAQTFVAGSVAVGGVPYIGTFTIPSYAPRREFIHSFHCPEERSAFRSEYVEREVEKRYESLLACAEKWFGAEPEEADISLLKSASGVMHHLLEDVSRVEAEEADTLLWSAGFEAEFKSKRAELEPMFRKACSWVWREVYPVHALFVLIFARVFGSVIGMCHLHWWRLPNFAVASRRKYPHPDAWEAENFTRLVRGSEGFVRHEVYPEEFRYLHEFELRAIESRLVCARLNDIRSAHVDVKKMFREEINFELDGQAHVPAALGEKVRVRRVRDSGKHFWVSVPEVLERAIPEVKGKFEELWITECYERGWLQAIYQVGDDRSKFYGRRFYMPGKIVTKATQLGYTDFRVDVQDWFNRGLEVPEDAPDFRPTEAMGVDMWRRFRDRQVKRMGRRFSYYGVQEMGAHSDNFHLHLFIHFPAGSPTAKAIQRSWSRVWHSVSGNVIWKPREEDKHSRDGTGRWLEPVKRRDGPCAYYASKYLAKDGGRIYTSQCMFLRDCIKEQWLIDNLLINERAFGWSPEPQFEEVDGAIQYKRRFLNYPEHLETAGCQEWVGFQFHEGNLRGNAVHGPRVTLSWTARSDKKSVSVGSAHGLKVRLPDGHILPDGASIPACSYRLPAHIVRLGVHRVPDIQARFRKSKLALSKLLQEKITSATPRRDVDRLYKFYQSIESEFEYSFSGVQFAIQPRAPSPSEEPESPGYPVLAGSIPWFRANPDG